MEQPAHAPHRAAVPHRRTGLRLPLLWAASDVQCRDRTAGCPPRDSGPRSPTRRRPPPHAPTTRPNHRRSGPVRRARSPLRRHGHPPRALRPSARYRTALARVRDGLPPARHPRQPTRGGRLRRTPRPATLALPPQRRALDQPRPSNSHSLPHPPAPPHTRTAYHRPRKNRSATSRPRTRRSASIAIQAPTSPSSASKIRIHASGSRIAYMQISVITTGGRV